MKRIFMLTGALLVGNIVFAQHSKKMPVFPSMHSRVVGGLLQQGDDHVAAMKTTGVTEERVIAQSTRENSLSLLIDSVDLAYSPFRGSSFDFNAMLYAYNYPYNTSPVFNNNGGIFGKPQVLYDKMMRWTINPNTLVYGYYETATASYDAKANMTDYLEQFADSAFNPNMRYSNKFNTAKNIDSGYAYVWHSGISDNAFKQYYTYNAANRLVKDSTYEFHLGVWRIASKTFYTYDVANDLIQIDNYANTTDTSFLLPLTEKYKYVNTYDATHRLKTVYSSFFDGTALNPYIKDTFTYSGSAAYHSGWKEFQYDPINSVWSPSFYMTKAINATTGLPDTVTISYYDSVPNTWVAQTRNVMSYNAAKNPVTLKDYEYDFTAFPSTPNFTTTYYYGTYTNIVGTKNAPAPSTTVRIFPNPAAGDITITGIDVPANSSVTISLVNVKGQMVNRTGVHWQNGAKISMSDLVPGVYQVVIQGAAGELLHSQAVVKQ